MNHLKDVNKIGKKMDKAKLDGWVQNYKDKHEGETFGWLYGCDTLQEILKEEGCKGIWFFKGLTEEGKERLVLYPADHEGNFLKKFKSLGAKSGDDITGAWDFSTDCPTECPG